MALEGPLRENSLLEKAEVLSTEVDKCTINEFKVRNNDNLYQATSFCTANKFSCAELNHTFCELKVMKSKSTYH